MKSVYVVSDLHMFCRRSQWEDHLPEIHKAAAEAELFVFNGDTVDFKWTSLSSIEDTVAGAVKFFEDFAARYPQCRIHINLGNHDHVEPFIRALDDLARRTPNLTWHPYYLRVKDTLFLHGDVAQRKMSHHELERFRAGWLHHRKQGRIKNRVYDAAFRAKAHVAISRIAFPPKRTLRRVSSYLRDIGHEVGDGVRCVYFGHTHVPVSGAQYRGITFHNGGAPMRGIPFNLLKAEV